MTGQGSRPGDRARPGPRAVPALLAEAVAAMPSHTAPQVAALEDELCAHYGVPHAVAVSSGTAALHTALIAAGIGPGDEVLVPAAAVVMTIAAVHAAGARPVFVDATGHGLPLDLGDAAAKTGPATRALLPVHLAGRTAGSLEAAAFANDHGLLLIEDACQAQGSRIGGHLAGTLGAIGCFSLKDGKIISSGEGGYLLARDPVIAATARAFRSHWQTPAGAYPSGARLGLNLRLAEPLAALARTSLAGHPAALARRRAQTRLLTDRVGAVPGLEPVLPAIGENPNGYAALWRITLAQPRAFAARLAQAGVVNSTATFGLKAASIHPAAAEFDPAPCPNAERLLDAMLAVPVTAADSDIRLAAVADVIVKEARAWSG